MRIELDIHAGRLTFAPVAGCRTFNAHVTVCGRYLALARWDTDRSPDRTGPRKTAGGGQFYHAVLWRGPRMAWYITWTSDLGGCRARERAAKIVTAA